MRESHFDVVAVALIDELVAGDRDQIDRPLAGVLDSMIRAEWVCPQVGVVVALEDEIDVVLVKDGNPVLTHGRRIAPGMRGIDRVVEDHELPGRPWSRLSTWSSHSACRFAWIGVADGERAVEHREERIATFEVVDQVGIEFRLVRCAAARKRHGRVEAPCRGIHGCPRTA